MCYFSPPTYDRDTEIIEKVEIKGNRAEITTQNASRHRKGQLTLYTLVDVEGEWRVDQRKQLLPDGQTKKLQF